MATIKLKGTPVHTAGMLPEKNQPAPPFKLTNVDLADVSLDQFKGKKKILNIVPSIDTGVCAMSTRRFNKEIADRKDTVVLNISADLPFAQKRFFEAEKIANVTPLSTMRAHNFGKEYGVVMVDGPLAGLMSRAVIVLNADNQVVYTEQVPDISNEPNYGAALAALDRA
jgi:thiol peroxidase